MRILISSGAAVSVLALASAAHAQDTAPAEQEQAGPGEAQPASTTDRTVYPGTMGHVKIHCRWRSGAWRVWRTVNNMFDLGLM